VRKKRGFAAGGRRPAVHERVTLRLSPHGCVEDLDATEETSTFRTRNDAGQAEAADTETQTVSETKPVATDPTSCHTRVAEAAAQSKTRRRSGARATATLRWRSGWR
jgi:hypothetical protein